MIDFIRDLGNILTNSRQMFKIIFAERRGLSSAIGVLLFISLGQALVSVANIIDKLYVLINIMGAQGGVFLEHLTLLVGLILTGVLIVVDVVLWLVYGILIHLFAKLLNGKGDFEKTLITLGYSKVAFFAYILLAFVALFVNIFAVIGLILLGLIISLILWFIIVSVGVSEVHRISLGKGLLSIVLATLILFSITVMLPIISLNIMGV